MKSPNNVLLFFPNLIGYLRILLALGSFYFMQKNNTITFWLYFWSCLLDALDGFAARTFNQCTRFGAVLDMVTDRCTTSCMLVMLAVLFPRYALVCQVIIALDIGSHWMHMYISLFAGRKSHKTVSNTFLQIYYQKAILFFVCFGNESFFCSCYMLHWDNRPLVWGFGIWQIVFGLTAPVAALKQFLNMVQLIEASKELLRMDALERENVETSKNN